MRPGGAEWPCIACEKYNAPFHYTRSRARDQILTIMSLIDIIYIKRDGDPVLPVLSYALVALLAPFHYTRSRCARPNINYYVSY